jgi:hypothetical protein
MSGPQHKPFFRGIIHVHTYYSVDAVTSPEQILNFAMRWKLDFAIVTDHDSTAGSRAVASAAQWRRATLEVPLAAEYKTDRGDVIVAYLPGELDGTSFSTLVHQAREHGCVLMLPHPYVSHKDPEALAPFVDLIEVYNARVRADDNRRALELAQHAGKPAFYGSDAHLPWNLRHAVVEVPNLGSIQTSLQNGQMRPFFLRSTARWEVLLSQYVKAVRSSDLRLLFRLTRGALGSILRRSFGRRGPRG